jgi:uncharacterized protein YpmS
MNYRLLVAGAILTLVSLACNFGLKTTPQRSTPIPVTTQAVQSLEATVQQAQATAQSSGTVNVSINETQLTSLIALELQNSGDTSIKNLQAHLQDGQVQLTANVNQNGINLPAGIDLEPQIVGDGQLQLNVVSAHVGPLPLPESMQNDLETSLNQVFTEQLNTLAPDTRIEQVTIENGMMTIAGHQR